MDLTQLRCFVALVDALHFGQAARQLVTCSLDLAFIRPPEHQSRQLRFLKLYDETAMVAVPSQHSLSRRTRLAVHDIAHEPLILPNRRSSPHSHDFTIKLFGQAGLRPVIAQAAEEKQTIINLVAAGLGIAIVPHWSSRMNVAGVRYVKLELTDAEHLNILPLAAVWVRDARDTARDAALDVLRANLANYVQSA